jgi:cytochrome c peroxidase
MFTKNTLSILLVGGLVVLTSLPACLRDTSISLSETDYFPPKHYHFPKDINYTKAKKLGEKLFFDPILSLDSSLSCASCHHPESAFSDPGMPVSIGIKGRKGMRNSPPLFNVAWHPHFMWDGGVNHIEVVSIAPITDTVEMGMELLDLVLKLRNKEEYVKLFKDVFKTDSLISRDILMALTAFMISLRSDQTPFDKFMKGALSMSESQQRGFEIFKNKCNECHTAPLFTDFSFRNNGMGFREEDPGRYRITLQESDKGKFKVPSLRNLKYSFPYKHDGSIETLDKVLLHYTHPTHSSTDPFIQQNPLLKEEINDLKSFLEMLND